MNLRNLDLFSLELINLGLCSTSLKLRLSREMNFKSLNLCNLYLVRRFVIDENDVYSYEIAHKFYIFNFFQKKELYF